MSSRTPFATLARPLTGSVRRQLTLGVVLVHAVLMTLFVLDLVAQQRAFLHRQAMEQARSLANTLAANSTSWVLARDVVGLGEVIQSLKRYPDLRYAMVLGSDGRVLAHSEPAHVGTYVQDGVSRSLLQGVTSPRVLVENSSLIDVAIPISANGYHLGWARIGLGQEQVAAGLRGIKREGMLYTLAAIAAGILFATWMARRVTRGLKRLLDVSEKIRLGRRDVRIRSEQEDEVGAVSRSFDAMLDAISDSEERMRLVLDSTAEGIFGVDMEGRCTFCNPAAARLLGYGGPGVLLGKYMHELTHHTHPDGSPYPKSECRGLEAVRRGAGILVEDEIFWRADGTSFPVEYWAHPMRRNGVVIGSVVAFSDTTERLQVARRLQTQLQFTQTLIDTIPNPIFYKNRELRYVGCNRAYEEFLGQSRQAIIGREAEDIFPPETAGRYRQWDPALLSQGGTQVQEMQLDHADGSRRSMMLYQAAHHSPDGQRDGIVGILLDVTQLKNAQDQLRLAAKVFENSREAIVITDAENRIVSINRSFSDITGYESNEVIGRTPSILNSGEHGREFFAALWSALKKDGYWQGEIWNRRKNGELYPEWLAISTVADEQGHILHHIGIFSDITERKMADERIRFLAQHDALTGLPNRLLLEDRLRQAIASAQRQGERVAVIFVDLDHFKTINDSLGHHMGDRLLKEVAVRLTACVRASDTVSRQGGDEFVIVLAQVTDPDDVAQVAKKVLAGVGQPYAIEGLELHTTPSVGIALYPDDGSDTATLIKNADAAMYHAKDRGRNNYQYFTQALNSRAFERLSLENSLRRALERNEFLLHYQPQFNLESGAVIGAEALIRWQHPDYGLMPPNKFIPVAEDSGLIIPLGEWVLREVCRQNRAWQETGLPPIPVAANLSALQFRQENLVESIGRILRESGLAPHLLELELTESAIMKSGEATVETLRQLKGMGLRLSIDDFGTGYSSLGYLKRFPIDKLKIDRSFVRDITTDPDDAAITRAVVGMAQSLRLQVIAEGVETVEQADFLRAEGCHEIQGYLYSKPLGAAEFETFLRKWRVAPQSKARES